MTLTQAQAVAATANKPMNIQKTIEAWVVLGDQWKIKLSGTATAGMPEVGSPYFGCHCTYMNNIKVQPDWNSLTKLDGTKVPTDQWGGGPRTGKGEIQKLLDAYVIPQEIKEDIFKGLLARYVPKGPGLQNTDSYVPRIGPYGPTFVLMSDNINSWTPDFPKDSGIHSPTIVKGLKTSEFAQWLMDNEIGIVIASPIGRNQFHQTKENFSLTRAWIWMPPGHAYYAMPDSARVTGTKVQPTRQGWMEDILVTMPHLEEQAKIDGLEKVLGKQLFKSGKIPW